MERQHAVTGRPRSGRPHRVARVDASCRRPRIGLTRDVELYGSGFSGRLPATTVDVSPGGVCVLTPTPIATDGISAVGLQLGGERVRFGARGSWQRPVEGGGFMTGIAFSAPAPRETSLLWDLVLERGSELARFLHGLPGLERLGIDALMSVCQIVRARDVATRDVVGLLPCDSAKLSSVFVVFRGSVSVQLRRRSGCAAIRRHAGPGNSFGAWAGVHAEPAAQYAVALEHTELLEISSSAFEHLRVAHPIAAEAVFDTLGNTDAAPIVTPHSGRETS